MIVVDSSVRIDHFNGTATRETEILDTLLGVEPIVIRLTALGIRGVPESTKEAATALGLSNPPEDALEGNKLV